MLSGGWLLTAAPAPAAPTTETFEFTGEAQEFVVPANVCQVTIDTHGAQGGDGEGQEGNALGALGGRATAAVEVTPGETLLVFVGGQGEPPVVTPEAADVADLPDGPGASVRFGVDMGGAGGFNGGGEGAGPGHDTPGGGGGGASDVRQGGGDLSNRVVVAGGGGGGGGADDGDPGSGNGGAGGGETGGDGSPGTGDDTPTPGGEGGTQTEGGAGGALGAASGEIGSLGQGGAGGESTDGPNDGGGGGGGGLFGGGGGAGDDNETDDAGGGGGGSGFGPADVEFETGVREGDGVVTITFDPDAGGCPVEQQVTAVVAEPRFTG
jgi:hypothetical protein